MTVLYIDQLLALLGFSLLIRRVPRLPMAIPFAVVLAVVLVFDTVVYLSILHGGHAAYRQMLIRGVVSTSIGGLVVGLVWGVYLQRRMLHRTDDLRQILRYVFFATMWRSCARRPPVMI